MAIWHATLDWTIGASVWLIVRGRWYVYKWCYLFHSIGPSFLLPQFVGAKYGRTKERQTIECRGSLKLHLRGNIDKNTLHGNFHLQLGSSG